ncbi:Probable receptor-like protein kinase [Striga hermonthica]|uniref:Probable receptor-like protein kinase n=1 Tax=Striga hermonthica TaxID=68872 RepID=A0A9N7NL16_STRHE|nr:Probable receptor-like protein kinase [Striga hermonthica]
MRNIKSSKKLDLPARLIAKELADSEIYREGRVTRPSTAALLIPVIHNPLLVLFRRIRCSSHFGEPQSAVLPIPASRSRCSSSSSESKPLLFRFRRVKAAVLPKKIGLVDDGIKAESWDVKNSKGRKKKDKIDVDADDETLGTGCWLKLRFIGSCISSRSKVDNSISGISTHGHLTSKSDVYSFGVVLLEMITGRRSMDKNRPNGEHNLVEWARPNLVDRRRFYRLIDPRLEGHFSIKGAQKAAQLAARCLNRDSKVRPLMSEVVEALKPLPGLKDMASSSYYFQTMQADRAAISPNGKSGLRAHVSLSRDGQQLRNLSIPQASPFNQLAQSSPKPNGKQ